MDNLQRISVIVAAGEKADTHHDHPAGLSPQELRMSTKKCTYVRTLKTALRSRYDRPSMGIVSIAIGQTSFGNERAQVFRIFLMDFS